MDEIKLLFSEKKDGNMGILSGDDWQVNRERFLIENGIDPWKAVFMNCRHGKEIIPIYNPIFDPVNCDGLVTPKRSELFLGLAPADCLSLVVVLRDGRQNVAVIALIHAGRKGTEEGILIKALEQISGKYNHLSEASIEIIFGHSIGKCCYDMDLVGENISQMETVRKECGLDIEHSLENWKCTYCSEGGKQFYSHRRSMETGEKEGRNLVVVGISR